MFTIFGGKTIFDRWDSDQLVTCDCLKKGDEVVFEGFGREYISIAVEQDGAVVAPVPNFFLQQPGCFNVYLGWDLNRHEGRETTFTIIDKAKPDDYECDCNLPSSAPESGGSSHLSVDGDNLVLDYEGKKLNLPYTSLSSVPTMAEQHFTIEDQVDQVYGTRFFQCEYNIVAGKEYCVVLNGHKLYATACINENSELVLELGGNILLFDTADGYMRFGITMPSEGVVNYDEYCENGFTIAIYPFVARQLEPKYIPTIIYTTADMATFTCNYSFEEAVAMLLNGYTPVVLRAGGGTMAQQITMLSVSAAGTSITASVAMNGGTLTITHTADGITMTQA